MPSSQKWPSLAWGLLGLSVAGLLSKDMLAIRGHGPSWPIVLSLLTGAVLAIACMAQNRLRFQLTSWVVLVLSLPYALANLLIVMRWASIWSLIAVALAVVAVALSLFSLRFSQPRNQARKFS